jgi:hypothetical protein
VREYVRRLLREGRSVEEIRSRVRDVPGYEGSVGPFQRDYGRPHVYARDVHSGSGNCVCGHSLGEKRHTEAAPGVPVPERLRWQT